MRAEVHLGGSFHAIGAVPEVDGVQVGREDAVLRPALLELVGERRLADLAPDRARGARVGVLDELLRDRRAALRRRSAGDVHEGRAREPDRVDGAMLVEAPVLDRDDRLAHRVGDALGRHRNPVLLRAQDREHGLSVARIDDAVRPLLEPLRVEARDLLRDGGHEAVEHGDERERAEQQPRRDAARPAARAIGPAGRRVREPRWLSWASHGFVRPSRPPEVRDRMEGTAGSGGSPRWYPRPPWSMPRSSA